MKKRREIETTLSTTVAITCDVCKTEYVDMADFHEFLQIDHQGGYWSIFGDGAKIECDICQVCVKNLLGDFLRVKEDNR
jgi:antitoxin CcdA